jgi:hypothetical protein
MQQLFQKISDRSAWLSGKDEKTGLPVHYLEASAGEKAFFIQVSARGVEAKDGNVVLNGTRTTIKDNDYHGVGAIVMSCSWSDFAFSETSWSLGVSLAGGLAWSKVSNSIDVAITSAKNAQSEAFLNLKARLELRNGVHALEEGVAEENAAANESMVTEYGSETAATSESLLIEEGVCQHHTKITHRISCRHFPTNFSF